MDKLIEILEGINPEIDYESETNLVDGRLIDSLAILSLIADIEEKFEVEIPTVEIIPSNFNSAQSIYALIEKLQKEE